MSKDTPRVTAETTDTTETDLPGVTGSRSA